MELKGGMDGMCIILGCMPRINLLYSFHTHVILCCFFYRLVEEADYKSTAELFAKTGDENNLDNFIPKTESDFAEYAELIAHKLRPYEVGAFIPFLSFYLVVSVCRLWPD